MGSDWIFSATELQHSPSRHDGVSLKEELERRSSACRLVGRLAAALRVSLASQRAACVFLHRFFMRRSIKQCDPQMAAAACLLLASKAENDETQNINVCRLADALRAATNCSIASSQVVRTVLMIEEEVILALNFELEVDHSFSYIATEVDKVVALVGQNAVTDLRRKLNQAAWSFLNDSAITWACLAVEAPLAAKAAVYAAGLFQGSMMEIVVTQKGEPWSTVLDTPLDILTDAARHVLSAYTAPYVDVCVLPSSLVELVKVLHEPMETNELRETCVRSVEVPDMDVLVPSELLDDDCKLIQMDEEILFQDVVSFRTCDEGIREQKSAWVKCGLSPSSPSDPCGVEESMPLYSPTPQICAMDSYVDESRSLKRSVALSERGYSIKKAKFAL